MNSKLIITLLSILNVNRKTINSLIKVKIAASLDVSEIKEMFVQGKLVNSRVSIPSIQAIQVAILKAEQIILDCNKNDIKYITILDNDYPNRLKEITDPPVIIYYKGNKKCLLYEKVVAIIGTRTPTAHGQNVAERLGYLFGEDNFIVVSGLAKGVDEFGHKGCINSRGKSIAVLPCGLDAIYPKSNKILADLIIEHDGCIISEYAPGVQPFKNYFVERDRIQSALSQAVIVVETAEKGGTMHTVRFSIEQNKILACYKHKEEYIENIQTHGNIKLIAEGMALPINSSADIQSIKNKIIDKIELHSIENSEISNSIIPIQTCLF